MPRHRPPSRECVQKPRVARTRGFCESLPSVLLAHAPGLAPATACQRHRLAVRGYGSRRSTYPTPRPPPCCGPPARSQRRCQIPDRDVSSHELDATGSAPCPRAVDLRPEARLTHRARCRRSIRSNTPARSSECQWTSQAGLWVARLRLMRRHPRRKQASQLDHRIWAVRSGPQVWLVPMKARSPAAGPSLQRADRVR